MSRAGGEMGGELVEGRGNVFHVCDVRRFVDIEVIVVVVLLGRTTKSFRPSRDPCTRHSSLSRVVVLHSRRERESSVVTERESSLVTERERELVGERERELSGLRCVAH